jgi:hypothetical protein
VAPGRARIADSGVRNFQDSNRARFLSSPGLRIETAARAKDRRDPAAPEAARVVGRDLSRSESALYLT